MKNIAIAFLLSCVVVQTALAANEIKLCYENVTVFPWITGDETGLVFTELALVEKATKQKFKYIRLPWKRCQFEAQSGNIDGLIAASFNKDRAVWGVYPTDHSGNLDSELRLHTDSFYVYARKDADVHYINGKFENLGSNHVGAQLGYSVASDLADAGYPVHSSFSSSLEILKEMDFSSLQIAVLQDHETVRTLNDYPKFKKNIVRLTPPYKVKDQFLLFTKVFYNKNAKTCKTIWSAIPSARKSEHYKHQEESLMKSL